MYINKRALYLVLLLAIFTAVFLYSRSSQTSPSIQSESENTTTEPVESEITSPPTTTTDPKPNPSKPDGQIQATGEFSMYALGIAPDTLCIAIDGRNNFLCFENQAEAKSMLDVASAGKLGEGNCEEISGRATITYNSFKEGYYNTGGGSIKLLKVDKIIEPAKCGRLS